MSSITDVAVQALQVDVSRLEQVGANLANALTPGYKRTVLLHRMPHGAASFAAALQPRASEAAASAPEAGAATGVSQVSALRDLRAGSLRATGQPFDLAVGGPGYFEVAAPSGPVYTRNGQFQIDERGRLVNAQGYPVMGRSGEITLLPGAAVIDTNGVVTQAGRALGQLRIVAFDSEQALQPGDGGLLQAGARARLVEGADLQVRQGFLENANVDAMREMLELMRTTRHFESMSRVLQTYDDMLGTAIRKLGEF